MQHTETLLSIIKREAEDNKQSSLDELDLEIDTSSQYFASFLQESAEVYKADGNPMEFSKLSFAEVKQLMTKS